MFSFLFFFVFILFCGLWRTTCLYECCYLKSSQFNNLAYATEEQVKILYLVRKQIRCKFWGNQSHLFKSLLLSKAVKGV